MRLIKKFLSFLLIFLLIILSINNSSFAKTFDVNDLYSNKDIHLTLTLNDTSYIRIYYENDYKNLAKEMLKSIKETHTLYENLLGTPNNLHLTLKIINKDKFFKVTKIPEWINAIYYKKHIFFPLDNQDNNFNIELLKSLRHEYMHAFIYNLSNGNCVGWLDEGLAQWSEGTTNPRLWKELKKFLKKHNPLSLSNIATGYTTLPTYLVPVAYAESLFSVKFLINNFKFSDFKNLFYLLKNDIPFNDSFKEAFNTDITIFDSIITSTLYNFKETSSLQSFDDFIKFSKENNFDEIMARIKLLNKKS